ncbi:MAG: outer membrane lipoprotein carrier protein LolA [Deltaproteobacteria bacterium]|nr:outer membrane lipoprotein carrier protein LolA [Deltaproteobacteria bacterium]
MKRKRCAWWLSISMGMLVMGLGHFCMAAGEPTLMLGEILKKVEVNYQQTQAFTAFFRQLTTSASASSMVAEASGKLYYEKPRQMRWEYDKPEPQTFVANQQLAWLHVPVEKSISLYDAGTLFASPLAKAFFDGIVELKNNFEVSLDLQQSTASRAVLRLIPKKEDPQIKKLFLWIDLPAHRISAVESHDAMGNTNKIVLESQVTMSSLDQRLFQLEVPPSTVVLDMEGKQLTPADIDNLKRKLSGSRKN